MKISNVILTTSILGSILLFTTAGLYKIESNNNMDHNIPEPCKWNPELELNNLASEQLYNDLSFESVFGTYNEYQISPKDIFDVSEGEDIIY
ncbi:hypothetical protein J8L88_04700 [Aquimarina sp. MMG015]|uniref:hypothetical protein n=1 Tax=Aquimarina sp. MMG015 TaxID=2822689 RepID=UPI001B39F849|nr:hypothetical protein [Aquimarina sp. MMG015]MBQ4802145.1 hypothetical protein [Aquimarina sp. MMG015]